MNALGTTGARRRRAICLLLAAVTLITLITLPRPRAAAANYESITYLYGGTTETYLRRMEKTGECITIVAPDYYETGSDGSIIYTKLPDPLLIATMHSKNIEVTPFLSNHWNRAQARAMLENRAAAAEFLAASVARYDLDGLDIDLQNITEQDKESFVDFIRLLRAAMPENTSLTVCVAANPYNTDKGWQGGYDYAALSEYCDHVFMMTYDESYNGGPAGPVASYGFIEKSIKYGLKYVPAEKLMIGIPFYGRYWTDGIKGEAWTLNDIEHLIKATGARPWFDDENICARVTIVVNEGDNLTVWGGTTLAPGTYDVWYENERSIQQKLSLVRKNGLRGVGSWALGQEPEWMWRNYLEWLDGTRFQDIENHWAQSYIISLTDQGIIKGKDKTRFAPEENLTRAEAATLLTRLAGLSPTSSTAAFADTAGHWANGAIASAKDAQLVSGVNEWSFQPDRAVTREEFAVMAERYTNITDTIDLTEQLYSDVTADGNPWSNKAIVKLSINKVLGGYPDGTFRPKSLITRAEAAKVIMLLAELPTRFVDGEILPLGRAQQGPR